MSRYFAHISHQGKIRYGDVPGSIGVLESLDKFMPIGEAHCLTWDRNGLAVWTLRIGKQEIPGRWVIIERRFMEVEGGPDTDQGFGVSLEQEDGDTRGGRGRCWEMSAYTSAARHAAKCAESGRTRNVA